MTLVAVRDAIHVGERREAAAAVEVRLRERRRRRIVRRGQRVGRRIRAVVRRDVARIADATVWQRGRAGGGRLEVEELDEQAVLHLRGRELGGSDQVAEGQLVI